MHRQFRIVFTLFLAAVIAGCGFQLRGSNSNLPYKTLDDFEYLGLINDVPMTLIGRSSLPANYFAELQKWVDANKGKINLGNAGVGSASHLCGLLFQSALATWQRIPRTVVLLTFTSPNSRLPSSATMRNRRRFSRSTIL